MGQVILIVVAAAWAAVLLPPLLRNRAENRPNSSVSDFRDQLSSLQRAMPTRGVAVRSMGRSLAPSSLSRPAAGGRPAQRGPARSSSPRGQNSYGPSARGSRADNQRMQDASLRSRTHGTRSGREAYDPSGPMRRPATGSAMGDVKRRRANVLFMLILTTLCGGFLAVTTDSKAMVLLFAAGMIALGGYVYLLVSLQQREAGAAGMPRQRVQRYTPQQRRQAAPRDPLVRDWRPAEDYYDDEPRYDYDYDDGAYEEPRRRPAPQAATRPVARPTQPRSASGGSAPIPGSGESGRISYGRAARPQAARDPYAMPTPRDPRDPFGREQPGREITRGTAVRNGRHATGQHPVQRRRQQSRGGYDYSQAG